jgi:autoinducer 2-degrading protein
MYVVAVTVFVRPEFIQPFIDATHLNAKASRGEAGNVRWDFSQAEDDPSRFLLYEVYQSKEAFVAHQQTPHYVAWKSAVADWMAEPRSGVKLHSLVYGE